VKKISLYRWARKIEQAATRRATSFKHAAQEFDHMRDLYNMEEFGRDCCTRGYPVHKELLEKCWSV